MALKYDATILRPPPPHPLDVVFMSEPHAFDKVLEERKNGNIFVTEVLFLGGKKWRREV